MHCTVLILCNYKGKYKNNANLNVQSILLHVCNYNTGTVGHSKVTHTK